MSIPGFDAAQAAYDAMLPPEYPVFTCPVSGESNEDCDREGHECEEAAEDAYDGPDYEEPPDFDEWRHSQDRWEADYFD